MTCPNDSTVQAYIQLSDGWDQLLHGITICRPVHLSDLEMHLSYNLWHRIGRSILWVKNPVSKSRPAIKTRFKIRFRIKAGFLTSKPIIDLQVSLHVL